MKVITKGTDTVVNNYIDEATGELIDVNVEVKSQKIIIDDEPNFAMIYTKIIGVIDNLDNTSIKILMWSVLNCGHNSNIVSFAKPFCDIITKEYKIGYGTIKNSVSSLAKKGVLERLGSGVYRINPRYSWKGSSAERKKTMKYILEIETK